MNIPHFTLAHGRDKMALKARSINIIIDEKSDSSKWQYIPFFFSVHMVNKGARKRYLCHVNWHLFSKHNAIKI